RDDRWRVTCDTPVKISEMSTEAQCRRDKSLAQRTSQTYDSAVFRGLPLAFFRLSRGAKNV
ncbi:hypothetical protein HAX54_013814, partial [Datura stramonium]|nr:hypothetical protein [Datura stramonium]